MQDTRTELPSLVSRLISSPTPLQLHQDIETYFVSNAGFRHPLCHVPRAPYSRARILSIYDWYRALSPHTHGKSRVLAYNEEESSAKALVVLETIQHFHLAISPLSIAPARLVTNVFLERDSDDGLWRIVYQEDFYHPDHFWNLLLPPLAGSIRFLMWLAVLGCWLLAPLGHAIALFTASPRPSLAQETMRDGRKNVQITLELNPLHWVGLQLRAFDRVIRGRRPWRRKHDLLRIEPIEDEIEMKQL